MQLDQATRVDQVMDPQKRFRETAVALMGDDGQR